ncbi:hypothetical protein ALC62_00258 [Cyphomyrmex costatus]|uniref:Uncharacterized protein n=1 Tax=Cyphomyrmex costatus TaxID=456900 RepID=A0A195D7H2_9HYME|nr:hypothetical protein ALC62_00258 [Cyphomyrmex costatus]
MPPKQRGVGALCGSVFRTPTGHSFVPPVIGIGQCPFYPRRGASINNDHQGLHMSLLGAKEPAGLAGNLSEFELQFLGVWLFWLLDKSWVGIAGDCSFVLLSTSVLFIEEVELVGS